MTHDDIDSTDDVEDVPCQDIVELVTGYVEGTLDPATTAAVEAHLAGCDACRVYVEQIRETIELLGHLPKDTLSAGTTASLIEAFRGFTAT
jgi:anti-sigma factor RsiW